MQRKHTQISCAAIALMLLSMVTSARTGQVRGRVLLKQNGGIRRVGLLSFSGNNAVLRIDQHGDSFIQTMLELVTMTVTLKPDLEVELAVRAEAEGLSTEEFVNRELGKLVASAPTSSDLAPEERARLWREFIESHAVGGPPLSDYAVSRESIYSREDEML
ncbi:MAG: hypothetical protein QOH41_373 [Blastocatellia bacterium]|jgi:hypothetical protein|nr:hypothetical protein [Blastocatellia bacterium]